MKRYMGLALIGMMWATGASAITVDGTRDAEYGAPVAVQAVDTQFGDANPPTSLGGSELDAAYAAFDAGRLYLLFTGNHEPNFNKLDIFIDSVAGGENTFSSTPQYDFNGPNGWISSFLGGMVLDTGFAVDYHLFSRWGGGGTPGPYEADFVNRQGGASAMVPGSAAMTAAPVDLVASGFIPAGDIGPNASGTALTQNLEFAINDNNQDGVFGGTGAADPVAAAAVTTGMEFSIALADIGNPTDGSQIRIMAVINNGDHNYLSNQILGSLAPPQGNLGSNGNGNFYFDFGDYNFDRTVDAADYVVWRKASIGGNPGGYNTWRANFGMTVPPVNLNNFAGDQFFTLTVPGLAVGTAVPEPGSFVLAMIGAALALSFVRRN